MAEGTSERSKMFGGIRHSAERKCLVNADGSEISLRPKSLAVFEHLAAHADTVVSKDDLFTAVWGNLSVTDDSLVQCIADIRRALNDKAHEVLKTVPRQGYLLAADVQPDSKAGIESHVGRPAATVTHGRGSFIKRGIVLGVGMAIAVGGIVSVWMSRSQPPVPDNAHVAQNQVPTLSIDSAPESNRLAGGKLDAIVAELRVRLSRYKTIQLTAGNDADYRLVVGLKPGGETGQRLTVEALDTSNDKIFLADAYAVPADDSAALTLAIRIASFASPAGGALSRHLMSTAQYKPVAQLTKAECYAHGYDCTSCSGELETVTARAQQCLAKLLEDDPNDATAWALKSTIHSNQYRFGNTLQEPERSNLQARAHRANLAVKAAHRAEQLSDGTDTVIYWAMSQAYSATCDVDKLRASIKNGLAINPDDPGLMAAFGNWLAYAGDWDEGSALVEKAMQIDPRFTRRWWIYAPAKRHLLRGEYEQAHQLLRRAYTERDWVSHMTLAYTLPLLGRIDEARQMGQRLLELNPGFTVEKALQFYKVYCFNDDYLSLVKNGLAQAGIPSRGSSNDFNKIQTPPVKIIPINGAPIEYLEMGDGEPVLFVHGAMGDYRAWGHYEAAVSEKHRFISFTQRLHGSQPWPERQKGASIDVFVEDLAAFIKGLDVGPVHLVTWSFGGTVGTLLGTSYPELIKSAVHFEPVAPSLLREHPDFAAIRKSFGDSLGPVFERMKAGDPENTARRFLEAVFELEVGDIEKENTGFQRVITQNGDAIGPLFFSKNSVMKVPKLTCDFLRTTTAPTLIVHGELSHRYFTLMSERFAQCIPAARRIVLPGVKHDGPLRKFDTMTSLILRHVEQNTTR